jgi:hypothetical protein
MSTKYTKCPQNIPNGPNNPKYTKCPQSRYNTWP